MPILAEPI